MAFLPDPDGDVPPDPGSYLLVFRLDQPVELAIGCLGLRSFGRGWHVYAGSARGGLRARLRHHLAPGRPVRWHVDALRGAARLVELWVALGGEPIECALAAALAQQPGAKRCPGFGSTDCRCPGHLISFARRPRLAMLWPGLTRLPLASRPAGLERRTHGKRAPTQRAAGPTPGRTVPDVRHAEPGHRGHL
ncbi:MAG TPA: GIY-YIG nuclease family protein [Chloroflexota bacterium]|nr:GIY-YIG nuclease family protein [Chloroflexota bacterium]